MSGGSLPSASPSYSAVGLAGADDAALLVGGSTTSLSVYSPPISETHSTANLSI